VITHRGNAAWAQIYLARQTGLGGVRASVVLKTISVRERASDQRVRHDVPRRAKLAATLNQSEYRAGHEVDQADGAYFMAMGVRAR